MDSVKDEIEFLLSGKGMPYQKVSLVVAIVVAVFFTLALYNNSIRDARVAIIDLDNSKYSRELAQKIDASPFMHVTAILNTPADPKALCYQDQAIAVICLPKGLEKARYTDGATGSIGVYYDYTNTAQHADIMEALPEIVATENAMASGGAEGGIQLYSRRLFNPAASTANGETQGFLFFFSSMFFVFATIGMVPRLRLEHKWEPLLKNGSPFDLMLRLVPYGVCLLVAFFVGMAILRVWGDMVIGGHMIWFFLSQFFYIWVLGMMSLLFGWYALNPGVAASGMILFLPGGFILGGATGPVPILSKWVLVLSHFFPLTWEFHLVRDFVTRGASFWDCARLFGLFLVYIAVVALFFCHRFYTDRKKLTENENHASLAEA